MRFENGLPTDLYLNAHTFGAFYTFTAGMFTFVRGKSYTLNNQTAAVIYPLTVNLVEGLHPELFVANGSHGIWGGAGRFGAGNPPSPQHGAGQGTPLSPRGGFSAGRGVYPWWTASGSTN